MIAALSTLALSGWGPGAASASRFVYEVCDSALPGGGTAGVKFTKTAGSAFSAVNTCAQAGGSLSITETGHAEAASSFWSVPTGALPGGQVESVAISGSACRLQQGSIAFVFGREYGWPSSACGVWQLRRFPGGAGGYPLWIYLGCDGNYSGGCEAGNSVTARWIAYTLLDPLAPSLTGLRGGLLGGGVLRGHQEIALSAHDVGGGVAAVGVSVNGVAAAAPEQPGCQAAQARNDSVTGTVAITPRPCPADADAEWTLDTESYPFHDGVNSVEVCASDFSTLSPANTTCSGPLKVLVDNSCSPSTVGGGETLSARFRANGSDTLTVGFGRSAEVSGRLTDREDKPLSDATLCVKMQTPGVDARSTLVGSVKTDAAGRYRYQVPPGPNREVTVGYRSDAVQLTRTLTFRAHVRPTLRAAPRALENGDAVRLWGRLPGPSSGRRVVVFQAGTPGSGQWLTFNRATTDAAGRFHARHQFTATPRRTTYLFRVLAPTQGGYPWIEGNSKPVSVLVKGGRA